ncbi:SDR family oxidoreductase [Paenibacillus sp. SI8]|uniref:SDR family oxidoreductase n=1 Tax=unclassified Paenibacillus TaxID=185978 RepID=UPI00346756D1
MEKIKQFILNQFAAQQLTHESAKALLLELHEKEKHVADSDIAVIGMSCKYADTDSPQGFWDNLEQGKVCFVDYPKERFKFFEPLTKNPHYAEFLGHSVDENDGGDDESSIQAGYLKDIEMFDANFFGITPREASSIDPAHRLILELSWSAIEDAGYSEEMIRNTNTGVYIGRDCTSGGTFYRYITESTDLTLTGTWHGLMASRLNYLFNLRGPSMVVDTACSSGLVAVHEAVQALRAKECDMAIAGGISLGSSAQGKSQDDDDSVLNSVSSSDNLVRTFDKKSTGTVFGEGVAVLFLKPLSKALEDRDHIYAVIKGSATNNDGASNGITSPNPIAQEEVIAKAWEQSGISPETIGYIEAHGTGTLLGDPLEIKGLTNAFRRYTNKRQFCGIGSAKTNMGHLVGASGVVGIMKTVLSLQNKKIPASLHFEEPNHHINFVESPLYITDQLKDWQTEDGVPRRAGVSAFGFSGTNCHILLEEAPAIPVTEPTDQPQIFTLSGKSFSVLSELIHKYYVYTQNAKLEDFEHIAYTMNTGRGHYEYRLAIIASSLEELRSQLAKIHNKPFEEISGDGIYIGKHKVVSDKKKSKERDEISDMEKRELSNEAKEAILQFVSGNNGVSKALDKVGLLYSKGGSVVWKDLYVSKQLKRVSLPVYPFERIPHWAEIKTGKVKAATPSSLKMAHPMVDQCVVKSMYQDIYSVKLNNRKQWILTDHVLFGVSIVPGTAHIEFARELASYYYPGESIEFNDIRFLSPIVVKDGEEKEIQFIIQKESGHLIFSTISQAVDEDGGLKDEWNLHAQIKVSPLQTKNLNFYPIWEKRNNPGMREIHVDVDALTNKNGRVTFGARWLNVDYVARDDKEVFAELRLPASCQGDLDSYKLHPGMLDNAVNAATQSFGEGMYLPLSYKSFKLYASMPEHFYTWIRKKEKDTKNNETLVFDILLIDEHGRTFVEIEDYIIKRVQAQALKELNQYHFYETKWVPQKLPFTETIQNREGAAVIFKDVHSVAERIISECKGLENRIEVSLGTEFCKVDERSYRTDTSEHGLFRLIEAIGVDDIGKILYLFPITGNRLLDTDPFKEQLDNGLNGMFNLCRALAKSKHKNRIDMLVVTDHAHAITNDEDQIHAHHAALLGLIKVIAQEFPTINCRCLDLDEQTSLQAVDLELSSSSPAFRTAYRKNERYIEQFQRVNMNVQNPQGGVLKEAGVYVLTGGTGGIGLTMAEHLVSHSPMKICLLNRTALPDKERWEQIMSQNENPGLVSKLKQIKTMEAAGSEIISYACDLADEVSLAQTLHNIRSRFGKIDGLLHCAGVAGDGLLILKDQKVFDDVIRPKVIGTWLLDRLTREDQLDFFVCFSSISTLFGARGQGDYTAANSYLDTFSQYRNALGLRTHTINWPAWSEVGMAVDYQVSDDVTLFKSVTNALALHFFDEIMRLNLNNVIPGQLNLMLMSSIEDQVTLKISDPIKNELAAYRGQTEHQISTRGAKRIIQEVTLLGKGEDEYSETERKIGFIYGVGLGLEVVDIYDNFNALGGDSILATELVTVIGKEFPGIVDISDMFAYASIAEMSDYIDAKIEGKLVAESSL